jgi:hypothetical protein
MFDNLRWKSKRSWELLSGADCFHFSKQMHQGMARNLWNSLMKIESGKELGCVSESNTIRSS